MKLPLFFFASVLALACLSVTPSLRALDPDALKPLYSFGLPQNDAAGRIGANGLVLGHDGNLYGTTAYGGTGHGTFFSITPAGKYTLLHTFTGNTSEDNAPGGELVAGRDGNFYGTTYGRDTSGVGYNAIFKITPAGALSNLYTFNHGTEDRPVSLLQGSDGNFYGVDPYGGSNNGSVFKLTPGGVLTRLHDFGLYTAKDGTIHLQEGDGKNPGSLILGSDGNFYGTTSEGGSNDQGTIFKVTPAGKETVLMSIGQDSEAESVGLTQGGDGNLYGVTSSYSGPNSSGTAFKLTHAGSFTLLHVFGAKATTGNKPDGAYPSGNLVQGYDGNFYGTCVVGGTADGGTAYRMTPAGAVTILHDFTDYHVDGLRPNNGLTLGKDGNFYGTTYDGGAQDNGIIFQLSLVLHGIDVSEIQEDIKWAEVAGAAKKFAFVRATQGVANNDDTNDLYFTDNMDGARANGIQVSAYHFAYPNLKPGNTGTAEAQHFVAVANDYLTAGFLRPVLDVERNYFPGTVAQQKAALSQWVRDFAAVVKNQYGVDIIIYTTRNYAANYLDDDLSAYPVWMSVDDGVEASTDHDLGPPPDYTPGRWDHWTFKQYRYGDHGNGTPVTGTCPGVLGGTGKCDLDSFDGTTDDLKKFVIAKTKNAPVITSAPTASVKRNTAFSYQITARNRPTGFSVLGLPKGLKVDAKTGLITGIPEAGGKYTPTLQAVNGAGKGTQTLMLTVIDVPIINSPSTASGTVGKAFSYQITAKYDPTRYGVRGLPPGLQINPATGLISGTPTKAGRFTLTLEATNSAGTDSTNLTLTLTN